MTTKPIYCPECNCQRCSCKPQKHMKGQKRITFTIGILDVHQAGHGKWYQNVDMRAYSMGKEPFKKRRKHK